MTSFPVQVRLLFSRKLLETLRAPAWVVVGLSTPLLYLALFAPLLDPLAGGPGFPRGHVLDVFVPGLLVLMAFGAGMGAGWIVIEELTTGVLERLRVTPASRLALLLGPVLRDVVVFAIPALLVVAIALPFGYRPAPGGIAVALVLLALLTAVVSAWSNALGVLMKETGSLAAIVTGLQLPLTLLSGVLLPLSIAPGWMRVLAHVNPLYYAVEAARDLSSGSILTADVGLGFLVVGALAVATLGWATRVYRVAVA
jgi:ABC-2 type transport system permease protein